MKIKIIFIGASVFLYAFFFVPVANAETKKIIISEVQIGGVKANDEFVRLKNETDTTINLTGFKLTKKSLSGGVCKETSLVSTSHFIGNIAPEDTFVIAHPSYKDAIHANLEYSSAYYYLSNDTVVLLYDASGELLDRKAIGNDCDIIIPPVDPPITPPAENILDPIVYNSTIRINEILANPLEKGEANEFIELYNNSNETVSLIGWLIRKDHSENGEYSIEAKNFPQGTDIIAGKFFLIPRSISGFIMANSNKTISLHDPNKKEVSAVSYKTTKEGVSINYTLSGWRGGTPTPGEINQPNNLPETSEKVPDEGYKGVEVNFDAQGKDSDNDALKYTWDFGDGHKSYKEITTHTYEENGTYTVTLKTTDGKDDMLETFTIKIESMPRKDVRITSLLPNPSGNDTGNEWLLIENREKKSVNLKDYSIATGWKKLSNHPIREDFIIGPKKEAKLTHDFSLFTLPNQKGEIELRAPDGKVLQKIEYKLDKPVAEDAVYHKEKGSAWKWEALPKKIPATPQKEIIPLVPVPQEVKPTEIPQPIQEDTPIEPIKTKSDQISLDPDRPLPQDVLAYGTRVQMPDSITLALSSDEKVNLVPLSESSPLPEEESLFAKINTSLNSFLNSVQ